MRRSAWHFSIAALLVSLPVPAFDQFHEGFVLGGGIGVANFVHSSWTVTSGAVETDVEHSVEAVAPTVDLRFGNCVDDYNCVMFWGAMTFSREELGVGMFTQEADGRTALLGIGWQRFLGSRGPTPYVLLGGGVVHRTSSPHDEDYLGAGLRVAVGYLVTEWFGVELTGDWGNPSASSDGVDEQFNFVKVGLSLQAIAF